jgi:hypothetical protein
MNWRVEFEEPSEERRNGESGDGIPNKEHDDSVRSWLSLLPGNVGVEDECKDGCKDVRNTTTEPK